MTVFSVVLYSNTHDRFYEAVSFAAAARAKGKTVLLFLRGPALRAFIENQWEKSPDPRVEKGLLRFQSVPPETLLAEIRSKGKVRVYACSAWTTMLHLNSASVAARVDAVIGLNAFLSQSEGGAVLYI
jgi:peroxiredoxin family protein